MKNNVATKISLFLLVFCLGSTAIAQQYRNIQYDHSIATLNEVNSFGTPQIEGSNYLLIQLDIDELIPQLHGIAQREDDSKGFTAMISFPHPDGTWHEYQAQANRTMSAGLSAKYPEIKSYDAIDYQGRKVKWDITPKGLHVMIFQPNESTIFIDPIIDGNTSYYAVYYKKDFTTDKIMSCEFNSDSKNLNIKEQAVEGTMKTFGTCELRTYRLALAATAEYTAFHGGSVGNALAAQVTTMNRVNGVFERDMAITMSIIPNNNLIVYTNAGSDPYSNGNPGSMINQNQSNCDATIGNGNYDIGHVFGTNSGGLAGLGVVCNNSNKGRGVTGSGAPIGDPFDIDYVAHEMGHQFGANHTQNNPCNSVSAARMEPGSASTIMGYAGICSPNVQSNSDDHFHGYSLQEIGVEIMSGGHTCEVISALVNAPPSITGTNGNITVPANTPFALTATVNDPDNDPILYCWEQIDNQASVQPPSPTSTGGPNFRSNSPINNPTRYFPNLADLANGVSPTWEVIPSVTRTMNFRVTVRDQGLNVPGCNDHEDVTVTTDAGSGPFIVLYPSTTGIIWTAATSETVTWDIANTDLAPVNCASVDILLSTDGGLTYPTVLATSTPNDGSQNVTVPSVATTTARIMVINSNGSFFDISDNDFEIDVPATCTDPDLATINGVISICDGQSTTLTVGTGNLNDATDWQWYTGSCGGTSAGTGTSISVSPAVTTSYFIRGEGGCVIPGSCTQVTVQVNPTYSLNETASICQGQSYTYPDGTTGAITESHVSNLSTGLGCDSIITTALTVLPVSTQNETATICSGESYTYPDGSIGTTTESHTSVLMDVNGCDSTIITSLTVNTVDVGLSQNGFSLEADAIGATYQWLDCDNAYAIIAGETGQTYSPSGLSGNYAVSVNESGCTDTSDCFVLDQTSFGDETVFDISIYPNPSSGNVLISWNGKVNKLELTDARGRLIRSLNANEVTQIQLDLSQYSEGVYFIHLYTDQSRIIKELVKQ